MYLPEEKISDVLNLKFKKKSTMMNEYDERLVSVSAVTKAVMERDTDEHSGVRLRMYDKIMGCIHRLEELL